MPRSRPALLPLMLLAVVLALGGMACAHAQLRGLQQAPVRLQLPGVQVPGTGLPGITSTVPMQRVDALLRDPLALTRTLQVDTLLREQPGRVTTDPRGAPVLRGEFLAMDLADAPRALVEALGFTVVGSDGDDALGLSLRVVRDTRGRSPAAALRALQEVAPEATFTYQHLYLPAGAGTGAGDAARTAGTATATRVGLVDGGVDAGDAALSRARIERHGCNAATASRHGTAVAARLVAGDAAALYAADLWCGDAVGGATSTLVDALAWMARERVAVVNISLVGPDNPVLARAVKAMVVRGHVLVSAVGNDGPAAPPLFPAAYPGVIGVSGVDANDRVLPESGSGAHVDFSAPGMVGRGRNALRGTSFAAPVVARRAARLLDAPRAGAADEVQRRLAATARDLGAPGRDPRYGDGLLTP